MTLTTEELGDIADVDAVTLDEVLRTDGFGKFAILSTADDRFIQTANNWQPTDQCRRFQQAQNSDPWLLEYREGEQHFQLLLDVTLEQVRQAFQSYLCGSDEWRDGFSWELLGL